jgi:hypothetical protein
MVGVIARRLAGKSGNLIAELSDRIAHRANELGLRRRIRFGHSSDLPLNRLTQLFELRFESGDALFIFLLNIAEEKIADLLDLFPVVPSFDR